MNPDELSAALKDILGVSLKKGDALVLSPATTMGKEQIEKLSAALTPAFEQTGNTLIILPAGLRMEHISQADLKKLLKEKE